MGIFSFVHWARILPFRYLITSRISGLFISQGQLKSVIILNVEDFAPKFSRHHEKVLLFFDYQ